MSTWSRESGLTTVPEGAVTVTGFIYPSLIGISSSQQVDMPTKANEVVFDNGLLINPSTCGEEPVKSIFKSLPATVTVALIFISRFP